MQDFFTVPEPVDLDLESDKTYALAPCARIDAKQLGDLIVLRYETIHGQRVLLTLDQEQWSALSASLATAQPDAGRARTTN